MQTDKGQSRGRKRQILEPIQFVELSLESVIERIEPRNTGIMRKDILHDLYCKLSPSNCPRTIGEIDKNQKRQCFHQY